MGNWKKVIGITVGLIWAATVSVPTFLLIEEGGLRFFIPEARSGDMSGEIALATFKVFFYSFIAALIIIIGWAIYHWFMRDKKTKENHEANRKPNSEPYSGFSITVDSRDFINMDTEQTKVVFDGLERIAGGKHGETREEE